MHIACICMNMNMYIHVYYQYRCKGGQICLVAPALTLYFVVID